MTDDEFSQFVGQVMAVRKGAGKGRNPKGGGKCEPYCSVCARSGHLPADCPNQPRKLTKTFNNYFVDKKCHACQAVGHGWRTFLNILLS